MTWDKLLCEERISGNPNRMDPDDRRTQFERDYDRAVFSTPVRRLQDKAQVFVLETHDAVRTRLTHSIEVSTVARDLTHAATEWMRQHKSDPITEQQALDIQTIAATCGLIHDLGNPPFGHSGESAISSWFQGKDKEVGFFEFKGAAESVRKR
jgi:dGTPase